jgi:hypothetical protein
MSAPSLARMTPPQETDPGNDLAQDAGRVYPLSSKGRAQSDEELGAQADQDAGSDPGSLTPQLPLQSDDPATQDGGAQA